MSEGRDSEGLLAGGYVDRAQALMDIGRFQQALPELTKAIAQNPDDSLLRCRLSNLYLILENEDAAVEHAQAAIHLDPNIDAGHYYLAYALLSKRQFDQALKHAETAVSIYSEDSANLYLLARCQYLCNQNNKALATAESAVQLDPENADLHELVGDLTYNTKSAKKAIPHYLAALQHDPNNAGMHSNLAFAYSNTGKPFEAALSYVRAAKIDPSDEEIREQLFSLLHYELFDMPESFVKQITDQFDPVLLSFYKNYKNNKASGNLKLGSMVMLWLCLLSLFALVVTIASGEDFSILLRLNLVLALIYFIMQAIQKFSLRWKFWKYRKNN